jgi:hypothetical protein
MPCLTGRKRLTGAIRTIVKEIAGSGNKSAETPVEHIDSKLSETDSSLG